MYSATSNIKLLIILLLILLYSFTSYSALYVHCMECRTVGDHMDIVNACA